MKIKKSIIQEKSYQFALEIIKAYLELIKVNKEYILSKQLVKSGTSIGANVEEALGGQSKRDFIAKMSIAKKEARETNYWLRLLNDSSILQRKDLINKSHELINILTSIVKTSEINITKTKNL